MDILIRNVPQGAVEALKRRAKRNNRSLQMELLDIVERAARPATSDFLNEMRELRERGVSFDLRAALDALSEDRAR